MKTNRWLISSAITISGMLGIGVAHAQLLNPTDARCAATGGIAVDAGRQRMAWALECRKRYECASSTWAQRVLTDDSLFGDPADPNITGWEELDANSKQKVLPLYYSAMQGTYWNAPQATVFPKTSWASYTCGNLTVPTTACTPYQTQYGYGYRNIGLCWAGCYTPEMTLSFASGDTAIKAAYDKGALDVVTLKSTATLDNLDYMENKIQRYTVDIEEQKQIIYNLKMRSGGTLRVTSEHPLLTSDGIMHQAQELRLGQSLLKKDGKRDPIVDIEQEDYFGKVYNLKPVTTDYQSNIVVAQGYLSGSARYQNEWLAMINSLILRRSLPEEFITGE